MNYSKSSRVKKSRRNFREGSTMREKHKCLPRYLIRLCSDKAAFEVKFSQKLRLDMSSIKKAFGTSKHYEILVYTPHITTLKSKIGVEITFSKDGRTLIKNF